MHSQRAFQAVLGVEVAGGFRGRLLLTAGWLAVCLLPAYGGQPPRNAAPGVGYVGSKVCAACHRAIYDQYVRTPMGRSLVALPSAMEPAAPPESERIPAATPNRFYQVESRAGALYQTEIVVDAQDREIQRRSYQLAYVLGSENGAGYLVKRGNYLCEAPLSYYPRNRAWGLSPGYQHTDAAFNRPIEAGCVYCHSGLPQPVANRPGLFQARPFREEAIGCENCHGPGQLHALERGKGTPVRQRVDSLIVNPARLPPALASDICVNCHQGGDARVLLPGRTYADFRPGTPTADTFALFKLPAKPGESPESDILEHDFSMRFSKCFTATAGKLSCLSCHDPHTVPPADRKAAYYREKCLQCHRDASCPLPPAERARRNQNDCAACHMVQRDLTTFSHSALTNHRIVRNPGQPYPESAYRLTTAGLPDLVYVNRPAGPEKPLPAITLLTAYGSLAMRDANCRERYLALLLDMLNMPNRGKTGDPAVLAALASEAQRDGTPESDAIAVRYWQKTLQTGQADSTAYYDLGGLLLRAGRAKEAAGVLEECAAAFRFVPECYGMLLDAYTALHQAAPFEATAGQYLDLFPEDTGMLQRIEDDRDALK